MRFKLDENVADAVRRSFASSGHDVETVYSEDLSGATDDALLAVARDEDRAFVTFDLDFADARIYPPEHPGVLVLRLRDQSPSSSAAAVERALDRLDPSELRDSVVTVTESIVRIHRAG